MLALDIRTTFFLCGLLYFALALGAWVASARPRGPANPSWFGGGMLIGAGLGLLGTRGIFPDWLASDAGTLLPPLGGMFLLRGLHKLAGRGWRDAFHALAGVALVGAYLAAETAGYALAARQLCIATDVLLLSLLVAGLVRLARNHELGAANWMAIAFGLMLAGVAVRGLVLTFGEGPMMPLGMPGAESRSNHDVAAMLLATVFAAVVCNLGWLGLELQQAARHATQLAAERARQESSALLMSQIAHLERQRSLGEMATTLAHEVKQPLRAILSNVQLAHRMARRLGEGHTGLEDALERAVQSTRHATTIVTRISGYVQASRPDKQLLDAEGIVRDVMELMSAEAGRQGVRMALRGLPRPAMILGDSVQLSQVLLNLLRNAMQAVHDMGLRDIHITLERHAGEIDFNVRDTGPGLTTEAALKAGTPFFSTRADGMGVGLSISGAIAAQHGGKLSIGNAPGGGALATLTLPEALEPQPQPQAPGLAQAAVRG